MVNDGLVKIQNICKDYALGKMKIPALRDVSFNVESRDFLVIAGPSGSGKKTLLNIIGLIDEPSSGQLWLDGEEVTGHSLNSLYRHRRDRLGYIFQTFNLIPVLSVYENVEYPLILNNKPRNERKERVELVLEKVGLLDRKKHKPRELSGGQRQRVSIARAVVKNPEIVLADEPTANLDSRTGAEIVELMEKLNNEDGITFIFSSHDPMIIKKGKRMITLNDGIIQDIQET